MSPQKRSLGEAALGWIDSANKPFTAAWYLNHPNAWQFTHPHADAAAVATAAAVGIWLATPYVGTATGTGSMTTVAAPAGETTTEQSTAADPLQPDVDEAANGGEWMSIGVFALKPAGQTEATRVIQLAVDRGGTVRGSHYDLISDAVQDIRGAIDKQDYRMAWTIGHKGNVAFEVPLDELAKPEGEVKVHFPGGKTASWQTVPVPQ